MTYAVPVFVTDSALSSCGTPEASASVREPTLCGGARRVTFQIVIDYVQANPGVTVRQAARALCIDYKAAGNKLLDLSKRGNLRSESIEGCKTLRYFATGKPLQKVRRRHEWPEQLKDTVRRLYPSAPWVEILAALPGKRRSAISEQARHMGLSRPRNLGRDMGPLTEAARAANERNRIKEAMPVLQAVKPAPAVDITLVPLAIARMTPLEAAWMGRLAA